MKTLAFSGRNAKEIVRDKLNLMFGLGFPLILLALLSIIQSNIPVELFAIRQLAPGIAVFGLSFIALFSGMLIAKDRASSFMLRLLASPMRPAQFILGYALPMLPIALAQMLVCFAAALLWGLPLSWNILLALIVSLPAAVFFIALGLLCGSMFNEKQVGGVCGALLTNVSAWLSGTWFDLSLVGGGFQKAANALPFAHAVQAGRHALNGAYAQIVPHLLWVLGYAAAALWIAVAAFTRQMKRP